MKTYIINYTPFTERLAKTIEALHVCSVYDICIVNSWDKEEICSNIVSSADRWQEMVEKISHILAYNTLEPLIRDYADPLVYESRRHGLAQEIPWMQSRLLKRGEISVSLKHFFAIASIANGADSHGLIVEDDIVLHSDSRELLACTLEFAVEKKVGYLDIVGGCNLKPTKQELESSELKHNVCRLVIPRTRTAAGYILSKSVATEIANRFLPLALPIDWHLQALIIDIKNLAAFWSLEPVFLHGSELGSVDSWRNVDGI